MVETENHHRLSKRDLNDNRMCQCVCIYIHSAYIYIHVYTLKTPDRPRNRLPRPCHTVVSTFVYVHMYTLVHVNVDVYNTQLGYVIDTLLKCNEK